MYRSTNPDWLYTEHLQEVLGISQTTLKRQLKTGKLPPHFRIGKRLVWRKDTVERWIQDQEAESARQKAAEDAAIETAVNEGVAFRAKVLNTLLDGIAKSESGNEG